MHALVIPIQGSAQYCSMEGLLNGHPQRKHGKNRLIVEVLVYASGYDWCLLNGIKVPHGHKLLLVQFTKRKTIDGPNWTNRRFGMCHRYLAKRKPRQQAKPCGGVVIGLSQCSSNPFRTRNRYAVHRVDVAGIQKLRPSFLQVLQSAPRSGSNQEFSADLPEGIAFFP